MIWICYDYVKGNFTRCSCVDKNHRKDYMIRNNTKNKRGFTIIEVVLVLAIAGLIFLMVFIALPALQRSQRNTQRRDDYSMLVTSINSYMASNNGRLSNIFKSGASTVDPRVLVAARWINESGKDPNGNPYGLYAYSWNTYESANATPGAVLTKTVSYCDIDGKVDQTACTNAGGTWETTTTDASGSEVFVITQANCNGTDTNGDPAPSKDTAARSFAVYGYLEGGGYFCQDSGSNS